MPKRYNAEEVAEVLARVGITHDRNSGETVFTGAFRGSERTVSVPRKHKKKEIPAGTLGSILRQANLTRAEFDALYNGKVAKAQLEQSLGCPVWMRC